MSTQEQRGGVKAPEEGFLSVGGEFEELRAEIPRFQELVRRLRIQHCFTSVLIDNSGNVSVNWKTDSTRARWGTTMNRIIWVSLWPRDSFEEGTPLVRHHAPDLQPIGMNLADRDTL